VCFSFNTKGCDREKCIFTHKKLATSSEKRTKCKECSAWHRPSVRCKSSAHQAQAQAQAQESETHEEEGESESESSQGDDEGSPVVGGMASLLNSVTFSKSDAIKQALQKGKSKQLAIQKGRREKKTVSARAAIPKAAWER
jgi:transcriptional regulator of heat shock response